MSEIIHYDPSKGNAVQGDVIIVPLPADTKFSREQPIQRDGNEQVLAYGEVTGHHHGITNGLRSPEPTMFRDDAMAADLAVKAPVAIGTAQLYKDDAAIQALASKGLANSRLAVGLLEVKDGPVDLHHQEHATIRIPAGLYYIGNQQEFDAGEARRVAD